MAYNAGLRCGSIPVSGKQIAVFSNNDGDVSINEDNGHCGGWGTSLFTLSTNKEIDDLILALIKARSHYFNEREEE